MKKQIIPILTISILIASCSNSRWVAGNPQHFRQRASREQFRISSGDTLAFKEVEGKNITLLDKPAGNDKIIISVIKH